MKTIKKHLNKFIPIIFYLLTISYTQASYADTVIISVVNGTIIVGKTGADEPNIQEISTEINSTLETNSDVQSLSVNFTMTPELLEKLRKLADQYRLIFQEPPTLPKHNSFSFASRTPPLNLNMVARVELTEPLMSRSRSVETMYPTLAPPSSPTNFDKN